MNEGGVIYGFYTNVDQWQKIPNDTPIDNIFVASNWTQAWFGVGSGPDQRMEGRAAHPRQRRY